MKTSELLKQAKALINAPEKWTQGAYARDAAGNEARWAVACSFCSMGAISVVSKGQRGIGGRLREYLFSVMSPLLIDEFNDCHTHEEVMEAWDKAIALAEAEGN